MRLLLRLVTHHKCILSYRRYTPRQRTASYHRDGAAACQAPLCSSHSDVNHLSVQGPSQIFRELIDL